MVWLVDSIQINIHYHNKMFMGMQTMLKIANKNRMIFLASKSVQAEERTFDEVDRWDRSDTTDPDILNYIQKFLDD